MHFPFTHTGGGRAEWQRWGGGRGAGQLVQVLWVCAHPPARPPDRGLHLDGNGALIKERGRGRGDKRGSAPEGGAKVHCVISTGCNSHVCPSLLWGSPPLPGLAFAPRRLPQEVLPAKRYLLPRGAAG